MKRKNFIFKVLFLFTILLFPLMLSSEEVKKSKSVSDTPQCSGLNEQDCKKTTNCTVSLDFFGKFSRCIIDCQKFKDEKSCVNAFEGKCIWISAFGICGPK